jgi:transposase
VIADGAYDGQPIYDAVAARHPEADVIIPPRSTAVPTETAASQRDRHIKVIEDHGRREWQRRTDYGRRSLVEMVCLQTINSA